jgi:uncharacterized DUF497 family protein
MIEFEWDPEKEKKNLRHHGVPFSEAATVFPDPLAITIYDPDHSQDEDRYITIGTSTPGRLLMVAHTNRGDRIRIINARGLTRTERDDYEHETQRRKG